MSFSTKITVPEADPFARWEIANRFFDTQCLEHGISPSARVPPYEVNEERIRTNGVLVLDSSVAKRALRVCNAQEGDIEGLPVVLSAEDDEVSFGGYFDIVGPYDDIDELYIYASWHDQCLERAFLMYKMWMVECSD